MELPIRLDCEARLWIKLHNLESRAVFFGGEGMVRAISSSSICWSLRFCFKSSIGHAGVICISFARVVSGNLVPSFDFFRQIEKDFGRGTQRIFVEKTFSTFGAAAQLGIQGKAGEHLTRQR